MRRLLTFAALLAAAAALPAHAQSMAEVLRGQEAEWLRIAQIEDARAPSPQDVETLFGALRAPAPAIRAQAARALGRLERPELGLRLAPLLEDTDPRVRAAAAQGIAQSAHTAADAPAHLALLRRAFAARAQDRALLAEPLGRLAPSDVDSAGTIIQLLVPLLEDSSVEAQRAALRGAYLAAFSVKYAGRNRRAAFDSAAIRALRRVALTATGAERARSRSLSLVTLAALGAADGDVLRAAFADPSAAVRRDAAAAAGSTRDTASARAILRAALRDDAPLVRYEALRGYARRFAADDGCAEVLRSVHDASPHVAILAVDVLGAACRGVPGAVAVLDSMAGTIAQAGDAWQLPAHALVSLARVDSARARPRVARFAGHPSLFVRTYAARAAAQVEDERTLRRLAADEHANVRTAAVQELSRVVGRYSADSVYIAQLARTESELVMAAARALEKSQHPDAVAALLRALETITALRQETSRDARLALLDRLEELGSLAHSASIEPLLRDIDPAVADRAADVIAAWSASGQRPRPAPAAPPAMPFPTFAELAELERGRAVIELVDGRTIELQLLPFDAPTNAARFARLAQRGYYDGLTLHRVVPNFVVQGGSPGANEYAGDGPFTRDEVGQPNWRGTVGLSTRGRDTGDAQFYINQIDNVRLDHEYTIFAVVLRGMDVVDALQEGARIRQIRIR